MNKRIKEIIGGVALSLLILTTTVLFGKGFAELIKNQSAYVVVFYGVLAITGVWYLGEMLIEPLELIFNRRKK